MRRTRSTWFAFALAVLLASTTIISAGAGQATPAMACRLVEHALGEACVPLVPQRVVVLDNGALDNALALGTTPVGTALPPAGFLPYLKEQTAGIEPVGTVDEPNLEAITALEPDLILGSKDTHEAIYDTLSQIAPTVFVESLGTTWKANLTTQAEALGKTAEAEQLMADYQARLEEFKVAMGDRLNETKVSVVRSRPDQVRVYLKDSYIGTIIDDAGLPRPEEQRGEGFAIEITPELIPQIGGDVIFVAEQDPEESQLAKLKQHPLWSRLEAVQQGRVYEVPHDVWINGLGIQAVNRVIDDLFRYLVEEEQ